jgi:acetyl esterase
MQDMKTNYNIHPDFARFPVFTFKFSPMITGLANAVMRVQRALTKRTFDLAVGRHTVESADGSRFDVITMTPHALQRPAPALLYYHGGAFALTYASSHLENCERYANESGCIVVFVDYRLGPKYPFPCGFDDCYAALQWTLREATTLGIDINRIAVGGDSAGGALAAGVAQKARDERLADLCAQLLIYPVLDNTCTTVSATDFVDVPLWNAVSNLRMWEMYLSRYRDTEAPRYAAPASGALQDLPLSYVETAEFDPLRDEGRHYAGALEAHGVTVVRHDTLGTIHGYDGNARSPISLDAMSQRITFLQRAFGTASS